MPKLNTRLTALLGIAHPIICGGRFRVGRAPLAAAVSNAGGLGIITSATHSDIAAFRDEVRQVKALTNRPFGVNINLFPATSGVGAAQFVAACIEESVPIVETSGRSPQLHIERLKSARIQVIHKVTSAKHAKTAERIGCDAVSVVGNETGGHPGTTDVGTLVLVRETAESIGIPLIAGGGFVDGAGLLAALSLGADGIIMGTRFLATHECPVHDAVKEWMIRAEVDDTIMIQRSIGSPMRVAKNAMAREVVDLEARGARLDELLPLITGRRNPTVYSEGKLDEAIWSCGQAVGLVADILTCRELIERIMASAVDGLARLNALKG